MKNALSLLAGVLFCLDALSQGWISPSDAMDFKGQLVKVVGRVTDISYNTTGKNGAARLTIEANQGAPPLTVLITGRIRKHFDILTKDLPDEYVQVNGRIMVRKGQPYIRLTSVKEIAILHQSPEVMRFEPK